MKGIYRSDRLCLIFPPAPAHAGDEDDHLAVVEALIALGTSLNSDSLLDDAVYVLTRAIYLARSVDISRSELARFVMLMITLV